MNKFIFLLLAFMLTREAYSQIDTIAESSIQETSKEDSPKDPEVFKVIEQMPRFPGCEDIKGDQLAKQECAKEKLLQYIFNNMRYPHLARKNKVEGMVVVQFIVEKDGSISDINVVRDIGAECGEAAYEVIDDMNRLTERWTPGYQNGVAKRVLWTLPIKFKLSNKTKLFKRRKQLRRGE